MSLWHQRMSEHGFCLVRVERMTLCSGPEVSYATSMNSRTLQDISLYAQSTLGDN